ncbi:MAG TPA: hypothetical protein VGY54_17780, partial [Polyangiaceae bacterium]|nr:hypothetical protein [Polyangiaceae bacterium]
MRCRDALFAIATATAAAIFAANPARADDLPAPSSPPPGSIPPPDIVRLKDGGIARGTIVELVPNDSVTIQLVNGQTRKFPMSSVTYAGPARGDVSGSQAPSESGTAPNVTVYGERATIRLTSGDREDQNLTFHVKTSGGRGSIEEGGFSRLCTAPCKIDLTAGAQRFGLSHRDGDLVVADSDLVLRGNETIAGQIVDRHGVRLAGVLTTFIGGPVGFGLIGLDYEAHPSGPTALSAAGFVVLSVCLTAGIILWTRHDYVTLEVLPLVAPAPPGMAPARGE